MNIGKNISNTPYLLLGNENIVIGGVQCFFEKEDAGKLVHLSKKESVRVKGTIRGKSIGYVLVKNCVLYP